MKRYPKYKDSGVEGISYIPKDWKVKKVNFCTNLITSGKTPKGGAEVYASEGLPFIRSLNVYNEGLRLEKLAYISEEIDMEMKSSRIKANDSLLNITGASIGRTCIVPPDFLGGNVNQHVCIIRPNNQINPVYLSNSLKSSSIKLQIDEAQNGSSREGLNFDQVKNLKIVVPSTLEEQQKINHFIDQKTGEIDELIANKEKMIQLLEEQRQAMITEAVTKGLNPNVKMRDSDVEWIGEIPEHWEMKKIKHLFEIKKIIKPFDVLSVLSMTQKGIKVKDLDDFSGQHAESYDKYQRVEINDYVMNGMDLLTGWVDCSKIQGVTSPDYRVFRLRNQNQNHEYFLRYFQLCYSSKIFYGHGQGVSNMGRWRLQTETFKEFPIMLPPVKEQNEIAKKLEVQDLAINNSIESIKQAIEKLKEYRKSLIYEAVTGKIDVRDFATE